MRWLSVVLVLMKRTVSFYDQNGGYYSEAAILPTILCIGGPNGGFLRPLELIFVASAL